MKPIKKVTVTELTNSKAAAFTTLLLTGAIAIASTGCSAEISADGVPLGSVVVNGTGDGISADVLLDGTIAGTEGSSIPVEIGMETQPSGSGLSGSTSGANGIPGTTNGTTVTNTGNAAGTTDRNTSGGTRTNSNSQLFDCIPDGTCMPFQYETSGYYWYLEGDFGAMVLDFVCDSEFVFYVNEIENEADAPCGKHSCPYLMKAYGKAFLYLEFLTTDSEGYNVGELRVYDISDGWLKYVGKEEGLYNDRDITSANAFWCSENNGLNAICQVQRVYKVSENGMPVPADNKVYFPNYEWIAASYDMTGYKVKNGVETSETITIKKGESVQLIEASDPNYIDVEVSNGNTVRLDLSSVFLDTYTTGDNRWIYKGLCKMFQPSAGSISAPADNNASSTNNGSANAYNGTIANLYEGATAIFDLRTNDSLYLNGNYGEYEIKPSGDFVEISYNGKSYTCQAESGSNGVCLCKAFLFQKNDLAFIYLETELDNSYRCGNTYVVTEEYISYVGSVSGIAIGGSVSDLNKILFYEYNSLNGLMYMTRYYKMNNNGMPVLADYTFYLSTIGNTKAAKDVTGYVIKNGQITTEQTTIKAGESITPVRVLSMKYLEITDEYGNVVWIDMEDTFVDCYQAGDFTWVISAVMTVVVSE